MEKKHAEKSGATSANESADYKAGHKAGYAEAWQAAIAWGAVQVVPSTIEAAAPRTARKRQAA